MRRRENAEISAQKNFEDDYSRGGKEEEEAGRRKGGEGGGGEAGKLPAQTVVSRPAEIFPGPARLWEHEA